MVSPYAQRVLYSQISMVKEKEARGYVHGAAM